MFLQVGFGRAIQAIVCTSSPMFSIHSLTVRGFEEPAPAHADARRSAGEHEIPGVQRHARREHRDLARPVSKISLLVCESASLAVDHSLMPSRCGSADVSPAGTIQGPSGHEPRSISG